MDLATALIALIVVAVVAYVATVIHAATMRGLAGGTGGTRPEDGLIAWPKWLSALLGALLLLWLLYRVRGILLPFVIGAVIAYLLHPAIDGLERRGWPRTQAITLVFGTFLALFVVGALLLLPALISEAQNLSSRYDLYAGQILDLFEQAREKAVGWGRVVGLLPEEVSAAFTEVGTRAQSYVLNLLKAGLGLVNRSLVVVSLLIITPVVAFWLLRDYHYVGSSLLRAIPPGRRERLLTVLRDINQVVGGYLLGMATMAVLVGIFSVVVLTVARVSFSVLLGIMTGVLSIIPYLGYPAALVIIALVMLVTGENLGVILLVLGVMIGGNLVSDYVVAPRVVGQRVGLHPLIVIFAMLAGGSLLGFAGVVLAVPLAGAMKVVALHFWPEAFRQDEKGAEAV